MGDCKNNNLDLEQANRALAESKAILEHFVQAYSSAYTVNLKDDTFEILHMNHAFKQVFTMDGKREDMVRFIHEHVHPDDRENILKITDNKYLSERLRNENEISFTMREIYQGKERTMHAIIMRGTDEYHAVVGFMDVTESINVERATRESLELANKEISNFRQAVLAHSLIAFTTNLTKNSLVSGFWVDDNGKQVSLEDILGLSLPCNYDEYISLWKDKFVAPNEHDKFIGFSSRKNLLEAYKNGQNEISFEYFADTIDGNRKYLKRIINLLQDPETGDIYSYTSVKDITTEKLNEVELLTSKEIVNRLTSRFSDIYQVDLKNKIVKQVRVLGKDMIGKKKTRYDIAVKAYIRYKVVDEDQEEMLKATSLANITKYLENHDEFIYHYRARHKGNETHYYFMQAVKISPLREFEQLVIGFACEDDIKEQERLLKEAMIRAQESDKAKSTFLFNMSHDIRTPMNAIIGFTDMAIKNVNNQEMVLDYLNKVKSSSDHLLSLINDVLDMSRVESGKVQIQEEPVMIGAVIDNVSSIISEFAHQKNLSFITKIDASTSERWISADRLRITRVLTNVLSNSVKYTNKGGKVEFLISEEKSPNEGEVIVKTVVKDNGIGMSKEFLKELFEPFSRAESSTKSGVVGTGLGMAITKSLVDLMHGTIEVTSKLNKGTTTTLKFPHKIVDAPKIDLTNKEETLTFLKGKRILLVEDNELNRELATTVLEEAGFVIETAEDGDIAVEKVTKKPAHYYDLVLMDIQMPRMNGYEASKAIRAYKKNKEVAMTPIIAMTANAFDEDKQNAYDAGMNGHVSKPINIPILLETITKVLS